MNGSFEIRTCAILYFGLISVACYQGCSFVSEEDRITQEAYAAIEQGMTLEEVEALLGPDKTMNFGSMNMASYSWEEGEGDESRGIAINFKDGRVILKMGTNLE